MDKKYILDKLSQIDKNKYSISELGLFGSYAKDSADNDCSDIKELETLLIGKKIKEKNLEDEYYLKIYKEYLNEKENGTLKTYSHKEVWRK